MNLVFPRALVQDILSGAQDKPNNSRHGLVCGSDFQHARVEWADAVGLQDALAAHPDALATLVTHPDTPPVPTADEASAPRPVSQLLLVASLQIKGVLEMRAFNAETEADNGLPITIF